MKFKIRRKKYCVKGKLAWEYNALHNLESIEYPTSENEGKEPKKVLRDFDTNKLALSINHPVDIECQPSYDGSTNIIFNDDYNVPRIVNSAFSLLEDNSYERVSRNQVVKTNIYRDDSIDSETRLQRTTNTFLNFNLISMSSGGQLPGGNYVFLAQYADEDDNKTAVVAESGIVSVFNGHYRKPETINGTLLHENTNKQVNFELNNVDTSFSKVYISYRRDFCDLNGVKQSEFKMLERPYEAKSKKINLVIDGLEQTVPISYEDLTAKRNIYQKIKTHTQNQNMLFFGNVEENYDQVKLLQSLALYIQVQPVYGDTVGWINYSYKGENGLEYHNPINTYNNLGYVPEEYYRIGVVFIYNDDSRSFVYNLRGCEFEHMYSWNHTDDAPEKGDAEIDINEVFIGDTTKNTKGVFRMPSVDLYATNQISPINLNFYMPPYISSVLKSLNIKGYYFVRQRRIPVFLAQGFSIGVSDHAYSPLLSASIEGTPKYRLDSIIKRTEIKEKGEGGKLELCAQKTEHSNDIKVRALICPDAIMEPQLQSMFAGERFKLKKVGSYQAANLLSTEESTEYESTKDKKVNLIRYSVEDDTVVEKELVYIPENTSFRSYKTCSFSTKVGSSVDIKSLRSIEEKGSFKLNNKCVRGEFIPFVGVSSEQEIINELDPNSIYNIYTDEYGNDKIKIQQAIRKRVFDGSEYTSICDPISVDNTFTRTEHVIARGDCFTCTSSHKFAYNFLDQNTPLNEIQVKGYVNSNRSKKNQPVETVNTLWNNVDEIDASAWNEFNVSDANSVDFGHYVTLKYMSNFNHSIRSVDQQKLDELSLYGSPRTFIPLGGDITGIAFKIPETKLHNAGLSSTRTVIPHFEALQVPYINSHFDTRIAFSNVSSTSSFANGYRVFSGVSYQDIERTYGAIVKLLPVGSNLFCVFEHGCGIIPVNEKALLSTTTGQSIHLYGAGVLQEQVTVISQDYGSTWEESIVVTPNGIYGVDTWAKKIWRYNANGFELISDQLVQRYLNDNITMTENDWTPTVALKNVKTHYNAYKGDIMFTFYKKGVEWNLCYNERIGKFTTRYSWSPLLSDNIQNSFVSIDKKSIEPLALIAETQELKRGITIPDDAYEDYLFDYKKEWTLYENIGVEHHDIENNLENEKLNGEETIENENFENSNVSSGIPVQENVCKFNRVFKLVGYEPCNAVEGRIHSITYSRWDKDAKKEIIETVVNDTAHGFYLPEHVIKKSVYADKKESPESTNSDSQNQDTSVLVTVETMSKYKVSGIGWGTKKTHTTDLDNLTQENDGNVVVYRNTDNKYYYDDDVEEDEKDGKFEDGDEADMHAFNHFKHSWDNYVLCTSSKNLGVDVKLNGYVNWIKITLSITPKLTTLHKESTENVDEIVRQTSSASGDPFTQTICFVANPKYLNDIKNDDSDPDKQEEYKQYWDSWEKCCRVGLYTHGRAGIYDEISYTDSDPDNEIKPTFWYNKQEPFEFEFVVNTPTGIQKVFENLVLISNNAEPESLEISLIGDAYGFNKAGIFNSDNTTISHDEETGILDSDRLNEEKLNAEFANTNRSQKFDISYNSNTDREIKFHTSVSRDNVLNQYVLNVHEGCRDVKDARWGKRLGNIEYREDKWLVTLSPIMFKNTEPVKSIDGSVEKVVEGSLTSTKLRDKWCKVRIKYKGDKLVVISAIQTLLSLSYS